MRKLAVSVLVVSLFGTLAAGQISQTGNNGNLIFQDSTDNTIVEITPGETRFGNLNGQEQNVNVTGNLTVRGNQDNSKMQMKYDSTDSRYEITSPSESICIGDC